MVSTFTMSHRRRRSSRERKSTVRRTGKNYAKLITRSGVSHYQLWNSKRIAYKRDCARREITWRAEEERKIPLSVRSTRTYGGNVDCEESSYRLLSSLRILRLRISYCRATLKSSFERTLRLPTHIANSIKSLIFCPSCLSPRR